MADDGGRGYVSTSKQKVKKLDTVSAYDHGSRAMADFPLRPTMVDQMKEQLVDGKTMEEVARKRAELNPKDE